MPPRPFLQNNTNSTPTSPPPTPFIHLNHKYKRFSYKSMIITQIKVLFLQ